MLARRFPICISTCLPRKIDPLSLPTGETVSCVRREAVHALYQMNCATIDATKTASRWGCQLTRNISSLKDQQFDVLIVGGGSFGACAAWEAVLRGYSVALIEANDFGSGTSANSFKFLHGGIRYLQHLDLRRLWSSCKERSAMLRVAPHLVKPLQIAMPTYGHGLRGKEFLGAGFLAYDALTLGKNRGIGESGKRIPPAQLMGRNEVLDRFGFVDPTQLTGAAVFSDAQMYHPPRLVFSFVQSAISKGACAHNYVQAKSFIRESSVEQVVRYGHQFLQSVTGCNRL